jgi:hypothetical protein
MPTNIKDTTILLGGTRIGITSAYKDADQLAVAALGKIGPTKYRAREIAYAPHRRVAARAATAADVA